ncbi:hypothetical protein LAZ67_14002468 [Cordylochernes scorpioides]|uniref:Uncharacterized protein n=1 Tax=Cordylochernes scorpioides TaxID=51811 RepID=A0ABY6L6Z3_9ARAC|nr:hypothetical protein LAZ67_14002468 [Cordylochernes scorpioides]
MFSEGREDVNEERAGRPSTSTTEEKINEVEKMILANRRITVREVAEDLNISTFGNETGRREILRDDPNLLQRVITGDEAGVVHDEFSPQGRTVNKEYYLQVMRNLREEIRQKRPDLLRLGKLFNNASLLCWVLYLTRAFVVNDAVVVDDAVVVAE